MKKIERKLKGKLMIEECKWKNLCV
jgi:hypothetical protein